MKVPEVNRCCFCCPLRWGIVFFAYFNLILSIAAVVFLLFKIDFLNNVVKDSSQEVVVTTVLFGILGMGVILNILLIFAIHKKDVALLQLYNFYALFTAIAAMVPIIILMIHDQYYIVMDTLVALLLQLYVVLLVRSEVVKIEKTLLVVNVDSSGYAYEEIITVPDRQTLIYLDYNEA